MSEDQSLDEKLRKIEEKINELSKRLDAIEQALRALPAGDIFSLLLRALSLELSFHGDIIAAYRKIVRARNILKEKGFYDPITSAIIELLALYGPLNISELARLMRQLRGAASRRIISERLKLLEALGLVKRVKGKGKRYLLTIS